MGEPPIVAEGLGRRYKRRAPWALRELDVEVPAGSIVALVGPNGAGKSTLVRLCLGFELPDAGTVRVFGWEPRRHRAKALGMIGYVPQSISLWRDLSVDEHLVLARAARRWFDHDYARRLVGSVGVEPSAAVRELSGGQQTQVALALALATRAPLLLLDEPLAGLDPLARRDFLGMLFAHVRQEGVTVILSSHLIADLEPVADWLLLLAHGRLVLSGPIDEIRNRYSVASDAAGPGFGRFRRVTGEELTLVVREGAGDRATLEDIVLGFLSARRSSEQERSG